MIELLDPRNCSQRSAYYCQQNEIVIRIIVTLFMWLIILLSFTGNLLVMMSTVMFSELHRNVTNFFIFSLALADFLVSITAMPFFTLNFAFCDCWHFGYTLCRLYMANDGLFCTASVIHLFCISVDRYIAVFYPLKYAKTVTKRRALIIIIISWIYSILITHIPVYTNLFVLPKSIEQFEIDSYYCYFEVNKSFCSFSAIMSFYLPACVTSFLYYRIIRVAKAHENHYRRIAESYTSHKMLNSTEEYDYKKAMCYMKQNKVSRMLMIIIVSFILCWLGFFVCYVLIYVFDVNTIPKVVFDTFFAVGYLNSCINPVVYTLYYKSFRRAFGMLLTCQHSDSPRTLRSDISIAIQRQNTLTSSRSGMDLYYFT